MKDITALSARFGVNAEWNEFPNFMKKMHGRSILLLADPNTLPFAEALLPALENVAKVKIYAFSEQEPVADEHAIARAEGALGDADYLLAVGSGTLNDVAKYTGFLHHIPSGVFATAPSMDGFTSGVAALIKEKKKITFPAQTAEDVLLSLPVLKSAPKIMVGAGVGDVLAKDCCLTDWRISHLLTGEAYNKEAADLMGEALSACKASVPALLKGEDEGIKKLTEALLVSGYAMVIAGNSRPASGAEHHMSHFLEMDFLARGERIPLHGIKVGLGTAVSAYLYHTISKRKSFHGCEIVAMEAEKLPSPETILATLGALGCPTKFSMLGIPKETVRRMLFEAYKIRDRFTILSLYCTYGLMTGDTAEEITERFY